MKRILTLLLVIMLALGSAPAALAQGMETSEKGTKENVRITAYTGYLKELYDDGGKGKISYVGIADVNKDYQPEMFYVIKGKSGLSEFRICYYEGGEVSEYDIEENYIGVNPTSIALERRNRTGTSEHCWVLVSSGKNPSKWSEKLWNVFDRSGTTLNNAVKFRKASKGSSNRYYVDQMQTIKSVFEGELLDFNTTWVLATDKHYKNRGVIRKVSNLKSWTRVRMALGSAADAWLVM